MFFFETQCIYIYRPAKLLKAGKSWRGSCRVGRPRVAMHSQLPRFLIVYLGRPTWIGKALSFTRELSLFLSFLSTHRAQHPRRGRPSNVFRRFRRKWSFNNWYRDFDYPSPNFYRVQKVRNLASFKTSINFELPAFEYVATRESALNRR